MDNFMIKYYIENYDNEKLTEIIKMNKILTDSYEEFYKKRNQHKHEKKKTKLNQEKIKEIYNKLEDMYYLSSLLSEDRIIDLIVKFDGDEDKIAEEIEKIL